MRSTIPIGIQPGTKVLRIERVAREKSTINSLRFVSDSKQGYWLIWLHANQSFTLGTYLVLNDDGSITNNTIKEGGTEDIFTVKGPDQ